MQGICTREFDYHALEGVRAFAVLLLVCATCTRGVFEYCLGGEGEDAGPYWWIVDPFIYIRADLGLDIVLLLSGLLIGQRLYKEFLETGDIDLQSFYLSGLQRVWPMMLAYLLIKLLIFYFAGSNDLEFKEWSILLFLNNFVC